MRRRWPSFVALVVVVWTSPAHAVGAVVGAGGGLAIPDDAERLRDGNQTDVTLGYAARGFGWFTWNEIALGLTALHVAAPTDIGSSTLTFVGVGAGVGSGFEADLAVFGWVSLGAGYSMGACAAAMGGELGARLDHRVSRSWRVGASVSLTSVGTGCPSGGDDAGTSSFGSRKPPVLDSALLATIDLTFAP